MVDIAQRLADAAAGRVALTVTLVPLGRSLFSAHVRTNLFGTHFVPLTARQGRGYIFIARSYCAATVLALTIRDETK